MLKAITLKVEEKQFKLLEAISSQTHVPKSALIRQGIELVLRQHKEDVISADLRDEIAHLLEEDEELLKRLAKA
jgi:hypothetical protein